MRLIAKLMLPLVFLGLLAWPAQPARARVVLGYYWSFYLDFENDFEGVLSIEVGPWEDGELLAVEETSTEKVTCTPVGAVALNGGDAVFSGGHVECRLELAAVLLKNHNLVLGEYDSYASILMSTSLESTAQNIAPIVSHPDANYSINFSRTSSVAMIQTLNNKAGLQNAFFNQVIGVSRNKYSFEYGCVWGGACDSTFKANTQTSVTPPAGGIVRFRTAPTILRIGSDGASSFMGRMGELLIDPGNSVH